MSQDKRKLKEDDIKNVSGGWMEDTDDYTEICPRCKSEYDSRYTKIINGYECCPYCDEQIKIIKP